MSHQSPSVSPHLTARELTLEDILKGKEGEEITTSSPNEPRILGVAFKAHKTFCLSAVFHRQSVLCLSFYSHFSSHQIISLATSCSLHKTGQLVTQVQVPAQPCSSPQCLCGWDKMKESLLYMRESF